MDWIIIVLFLVVAYFLEKLEKRILDLENKSKKKTGEKKVDDKKPKTLKEWWTEQKRYEKVLIIIFTISILLGIISFFFS